eukprot:scaffold664670_cov62-Prasinocladus_malaysianus.AAC.1
MPQPLTYPNASDHANVMTLFISSLCELLITAHPCRGLPLGPNPAGCGGRCQSSSGPTAGSPPPLCAPAPSPTCPPEGPVNGAPAERQ